MGFINEIYALRTGETIEFRTSSTGLRAIVSKLTRTMDVKRGQVITDENGVPTYISRKCKRKVVFKQTYFVGGRILGYIDISKFYRFFRQLPPETGTMVKLSPSSRTMVASPVWRRANLGRV